MNEAALRPFQRRGTVVTLTVVFAALGAPGGVALVRVLVEWVSPAAEGDPIGALGLFVLAGTWSILMGGATWTLWRARARALGREFHPARHPLGVVAHPDPDGTLTVLWLLPLPTALAFLIGSTGGFFSGRGDRLLVLALATAAVAVALRQVLFFRRARIEANEDGVRLRRALIETLLPWDRIEGLERMRSSARTSAGRRTVARYRVSLAERRPFYFHQGWVGSSAVANRIERLAGSIPEQERRAEKRPAPSLSRPPAKKAWKRVLGPLVRLRSKLTRSLPEELRSELERLDALEGALTRDLRCEPGRPGEWCLSCSTASRRAPSERILAKLRRLSDGAGWSKVWKALFDFPESPY